MRSNCARSGQPALNAVRYTAQGEVRAQLKYGAMAHCTLRSATPAAASPRSAPREARVRALQPGAQEGNRAPAWTCPSSKRLVQQLGHYRALDSLPGRGTSTASCCRRYRRRLGRRRGAVTASQLAIIGGRVVVLDDDPDVAALLVLLLSDLGFSVEVCRSVAEAVARRRTDPPRDAAGGRRAARPVRQCGGLPAARAGCNGRIVHAFGHRDRAGASRRALPRGADAFLTKPIDLEQLIARAAAAQRRLRVARAAPRVEHRSGGRRAQPGSPSGMATEAFM